MEFIEIPWYINVLLTILTSGVLFQIIQGIYFRRQKKLKETGDAINSASTTIESYATILDNQANKIEDLVREQLDMKSKILELESIIMDLKREMVEKDLAIEVEKAWRAKEQYYICFDETCPHRRPGLGTYTEEYWKNLPGTAFSNSRAAVIKSEMSEAKETTKKQDKN